MFTRVLILFVSLLSFMPSNAAAQIQDLTIYNISSPNPQSLPNLQVRESLVVEPSGSITLHARVYESVGCNGLFSSVPQDFINSSGSNLVPFSQCPSGLAIFNFISTSQGTIIRHVCPTQPALGVLDLRSFSNGQYGNIQTLHFVTTGRC